MPVQVSKAEYEEIRRNSGQTDPVTESDRQEPAEQPEKSAAPPSTTPATPAPQAPSASSGSSSGPIVQKGGSAERGVTAAFLVIAVLIAARHSSTVAGWISWIKGPAGGKVQAP